MSHNDLKVSPEKQKNITLILPCFSSTSLKSRQKYYDLALLFKILQSLARIVPIVPKDHVQRVLEITEKLGLWQLLGLHRDNLVTFPPPRHVIVCVGGT